MSLHSFKPHPVAEVVEVRRRDVSVSAGPGVSEASLVVLGEESPTMSLISLRDDLEQALVYVERLLRLGVHVDTRNRHECCDRGEVERS